MVPESPKQSSVVILQANALLLTQDISAAPSAFSISTVASRNKASYNSTGIKSPQPPPNITSSRHPVLPSHWTPRSLCRPAMLTIPSPLRHLNPGAILISPCPVLFFVSDLGTNPSFESCRRFCSSRLPAFVFASSSTSHAQASTSLSLSRAKTSSVIFSLQLPGPEGDSAPAADHDEALFRSACQNERRCNAALMTPPRPNHHHKRCSVCLSVCLWSREPLASLSQCDYTRIEANWRHGETKKVG